jgi:hypothetical protein
MAAPPNPASHRQLRFGRRNLLLLGLGIGALLAGYLWLNAGGTTGAAALLVLGYCVLIPLGIAVANEE